MGAGQRPIKPCQKPAGSLPVSPGLRRFPVWVAPADCARYAQRGGGRMRGLVILRNACLPACLLTKLITAVYKVNRQDKTRLPAYLPDLTIMNGHGAHRRQEGSQLAAEPACSRRVRAPSETWGEGCFVAGRGSYDKAGYVGVGGRFIRSGHGVPLGRRPDTPCPPPLRLINSVERTSTRPSHGKVVA